MNILRITLQIHGPRGITLSYGANHSEDPRITLSLKRSGTRITLKIRGPGRSGGHAVARAGRCNLELGATATRGACGAGADTQSAHTFRASSRREDPRSVLHADRAVAGADQPTACAAQPRGIKPHHKPRAQATRQVLCQATRAVPLSHMLSHVASCRIAVRLSHTYLQFVGRYTTPRQPPRHPAKAHN